MSPAMSPAPPHADVRGSDLVIAAVLTAALFGASIVALAYARLDHAAALPDIDPGGAIPIAVRPVADLPAGGAKKGTKTKKRQPKAKSRSSQNSATASAEDSSTMPTSPSTVPKAWRRQERTQIEPSPLIELPWSQPDASEADPSSDPDPDPDPDAAPSEGPEGSPDGQGEGESAGAGPNEGAGGGEGEGAGEGVDPLLERAVAFYRARLVAWFSDRFRVTGTNLSPAQLAKYRVRVHIEIGEDLRIIDYRILSSDHPAFELAARATLDKLRGVSLPRPPENYPGAVQRQLTVTFTCAEDTCD